MQIKINHADPFQQIQVNNCNESKAEKEQPGFCTFSAIQPFQDIWKEYQTRRRCFHEERNFQDMPTENRWNAWSNTASKRKPLVL